MTITYKEIGKYEFILCHQPLPTLYTYHLYILSDCLRYEINSITDSKGFVISKHTYQMSIPDIFLKWDKKKYPLQVSIFSRFPIIQTIFHQQRIPIPILVPGIQLRVDFPAVMKSRVVSRCSDLNVNGRAARPRQLTLRNINIDERILFQSLKLVRIYFFKCCYYPVFL